MNSTRNVLLALAAICILPIVASYSLARWWTPDATVNRGDMLPTRSAGLDALQPLDPKLDLKKSLSRKWVLLTVQAGACDERCAHALYVMRQVRTAQNENMDRVERVWVVADAVPPALTFLAQHPGLLLARAPQPAWVDSLPTKQALATHIYLIDPRGNLVLRYDEASDPRGLLKDLGRLLRYSSLG